MRIAAWAVAAVAAAAAVGATEPAAAQPREGLRERYGILLERNMFLKDRRPKPPAVERVTEAPPPPPIETLYVVIGLVEEGGSVRAHVEDRRTGELLLLRPGDLLASGRIESVDLDGVVYATEAGETRVAIGQDLRGETAAAPPGDAGAASSGSGGREGAAGEVNSSGSADPATMSIEERMRQRRLRGD